MKKEKNIKYYSNPNIIVNSIIIVLIIGMIFSQTFLIDNTIDSMFESIVSVINHNSINILILAYFIALKFKVGKVNFNYFNIFLTILYLIISITSVLALIQNITLISILTLIIHIIILLYIINSLFIETKIWEVYKLDKSFLNTITNTNYFNSVIIISIILVSVSLITIERVELLVLTVIDSLIFVLIARYLFLYGRHVSKKGGSK